MRTCNGSPSVKTFGFDTSATLRRTTQCEHWAASQREALKGRLAGGGLMPRRCRGIRGDEGIAPYGRATRVRSYDGGRTESSAPTEGCKGCGGIRGDAPQGCLFRFAPLRGHRPLRKVYRGWVRLICKRKRRVGASFCIFFLPFTFCVDRVELR